MKRSRRRTSQILVWAISLIVVLSMALGLAVSVLPQPRPPTPTPAPIPYVFAVCGDSAAAGESGESADSYSLLLKQVVEDGNFFLIHTGNLVSDGSESEFEDFAELMSGFPLFFYPVPGNRDHYQGTLNNYLRHSGAPDVHYSFDYGLVHFSLANSSLGELTSEELAWLQADLVASPLPVKMVFLHYPPLDPAGNADILRSGNEEFMALMEAQKVDYVFAGHIPGYHAEDRDGVHYVITGGLGAPPDQETGESDPSHYVRVTVLGTEVTVEPVPLIE
jgi:hypothetical protein